MKVLEIFGGRVRVAVSDKSDGNMRAFSNEDALINQTKVAQALDLDAEQMMRIRSGYDRADFTRYVIDPDIKAYGLTGGESVPESDGILINEFGVGILLPLADCLGVVLYEPESNKLMLVHAGRHNLEQNGLFQAAQLMIGQGLNPENIWAWFSPAAGRQNYQIFNLENQGLVEAATEQLLLAGIKLENIEDMNIDTTVDAGYFSHSQGDKQMRFAVGVRMVS
jgi:copper oxidase (laccase) domain-containing protein